MDHIEIVATEEAPAAIGPYSQAVVAGGVVYASGQIPLDPKTGEVERGDVGAQTHRVFRNLRAVLQAAGSDLDHVLRCTVYLSDMADFGTVNGIYAEYFGEHRPARATVQAGGLPKGVDVEIDAIALQKR
jgi:2-iminobutanoate/2-iminopropanoate deaminase